MRNKKCVRAFFNRLIKRTEIFGPFLFLFYRFYNQSDTQRKPLFENKLDLCVAGKNAFKTFDGEYLEIRNKKVEAIKEAVKKKIMLFGSVGKA